MGNVDLVKELRASERAQGEMARMSDDTRGHLGDRSRGFLTALSFVPVADDADAAVRAVELVACLELAQGLGDANDAAFLRLGWRLADTLADYLGAKAGSPSERGRQTAQMEDLLRRVG